MELRGFWLFGLRTKMDMKLPKRDGTFTPFKGNGGNFHIAYSDSKRIIILDSKSW
jgi:hypothetical protein